MICDLEYIFYNNKPKKITVSESTVLHISLSDTPYLQHPRHVMICALEYVFNHNKPPNFLSVGPPWLAIFFRDISNTPVSPPPPIKTFWFHRCCANTYSCINKAYSSKRVFS